MPFQIGVRVIIREYDDRGIVVKVAGDDVNGRWTGFHQDNVFVMSSYPDFRGATWEDVQDAFNAGCRLKFRKAEDGYVRSFAEGDLDAANAV